MTRDDLDYLSRRLDNTAWCMAVLLGLVQVFQTAMLVAAIKGIN